MTTLTTEAHISQKELQQSRKGKMHARKASLTAVEEAFLHALLVDPPMDPEEDSLVADLERSQQLERAATVLDDDILFAVPVCLAENREKEEKADGKPVKRPTVTKKPRNYRFLVGLWQAHEDGVSPKKLTTLSTRKIIRNCAAVDLPDLQEKPEEDQESTEPEDDDDLDDDESAKSDQKIPTTNDGSSESSWDEEDGGFDHFDSWEVLKDEYAADFGFDYTPDGATPCMDDSELEQNHFKIIGTSADDKSSHPHVLSPPLMDALLVFVPEYLQGQNMWLKYSLIRDGASLDTFKQYSRASKDTILAIETTKGEVFGCYTSSSWKTNLSFYGGAPSYVWRMRQNRNTSCHSLIDQAKMESEIDVYFYIEEGRRVQCCKSDIIGVGEGRVAKFNIYGEIEEEDTELDGKNFGFAIALQDDLLAGTTSKCSSYKNPCMVDPMSNGETFQVLNLELWTFTPCFSLDSAEKLEMTHFFVSESMRDTSIMSTSSTRSDHQFSSRELSQDQFYRRVGQGDEHEELRERWQYRSMMDGNLQANRGIGASPRFNNAS
jgi:hypothetical protein